MLWGLLGYFIVVELGVLIGFLGLWVYELFYGDFFLFGV